MSDQVFAAVTRYSFYTVCLSTAATVTGSFDKEEWTRRRGRVSSFRRRFFRRVGKYRGGKSDVNQIGVKQRYCPTYLSAVGNF